MHHVDVMRAVEVQVAVPIDVSQSHRSRRCRPRQPGVLHFGPSAFSIIEKEPGSSGNTVDEQIEVAVSIYIREGCPGRELVRAGRVTDIHFFKTPIAQIAIEPVRSLQAAKIDVLPDQL